MDGPAHRTLPGDDLVAGDAGHPDNIVVMDRATTLEAPAREVWPWLVQLGKGRAGWYLPSRAESVVPVSRRGLRRVEPLLQDLQVGDRVPDWGPGDPEFEAAVVEPPYALVYRSLRERSRDHAWPLDEQSPPPDTLVLSWALVLDDLPGGRCRLHLRLRMRPTSPRGAVLMRTFGEVVDYLTVRLLFAGLRERLAAASSA